jgi:tetratricopeptide (TPR) repeat protein
MRVSITIFTFFFVAFFTTLQAQPSKLAQQYFKDGEYEKAASLYEKLYKQHNGNDFYFDRYVECMLGLEEFTALENLLKQQIKADPKNVKLYVTYGNLYERQFKEEDAKAMYDKAIEKLPADRFAITKLASAFTTLTKYEQAIKAYEKGGEMLKDEQMFAYNLAELYRRKSDTPKMIENYLISLQENPGRLNSLKSLFQRYLNADDFVELQTQLYERIQEDRDAIHYPELLTWVFIQSKDYKNAFRQVKALDRRLSENGGRIYRLATIAFNDKDYDAAIDSYNYIVEEKGISSTYYIDAKRGALRASRNKLVEGFEYTPEDLTNLKQRYESFLDEFGRNKSTASISVELADLEAFYLKNSPRAIEILKEIIDYPGIDAKVQAQAKLSLGDFYLMDDERWEATLLYSQVDKAFKDDLIGHEARWKNAKLAYYFKDFQWAQAQFDVLKASTSKLIANDALDLSVFIMDNLGLDTTDVSIGLYADADLLIFQNRFDAAFEKLDSLVAQFPEHTLKDDVYYSKARIYTKQREYQKAVEMYEKIITEHAEEIRADNALFGLAELYEYHLNDLEKAKELYEKIYLDHSGSTFAVLARKKYRELRGDVLK